jgi:hypothetical protein
MNSKKVDKNVDKKMARNYKNLRELNTRDSKNGYNDRLNNSLKLSVTPIYNENGIEYVKNDIFSTISPYPETLGVLTNNDIKNLVSPFKQILCREFKKIGDPLKYNKYTAELYEKKISIYEASMKKDVPYRKLLYLLRTMNFNVMKRNFGRITNFVDREEIEDVFNMVKVIWAQQANKKGWIKLLKTVGFSKSGASHFMSRKIRSGIVPNYYFVVVRPSATLLMHIINSKKKHISLPTNIWREGDNKPLTYKEILVFLKAKR